MVSQNTQEHGNEPSKNVVVAYPILVALFPVISMYSAAVSSVSFRNLLVPILLSLALPIVLWLILMPIVRDIHRRALAVAVAVGAFWCYGYFLDTVRSLFQYREMLPTTMLLALVAIAGGSYVAALVAMRRTRRSFRPCTTFMNAASLIALLVAAVPIVVEMGKAKAPQVRANDEGASSPVDAPDIIYLVTDAYGGAEIIESLYGVDNSAFVSALEARGFYVADKSHSNYNYTRFSVASSLEMNYMNGVLEELGGDVPPAQVIDDNRAARYLRDRGYDFISYASGYSNTEIESADEYREPPVALSEFDHMLINATPLRSLMNRVHSFREQRDGRRFSQYDLHRDRIRFVLDSLANMDKAEHPRFVFAHIISPHWPYLFDEDSNPVYPKLRFSLEVDFRSWEAPTLDEFKDGYQRQVLGLNTLLLESIDQILANNPNTVILLQGDHGPRSRTILEEPEDWEHYVDEELSIMNAYYFPENGGKDVLYDSISPVNSFRAVFNRYLGGDFDLLEDHSYFYDEENTTLHAVPSFQKSVAHSR